MNKFNTAEGHKAMMSFVVFIIAIISFVTTDKPWATTAELEAARNELERTVEAQKNINSMVIQLNMKVVALETKEESLRSWVRSISNRVNSNN